MDDWKMVPVEPTPEMVAAMAKAWQDAVAADDPDECIAEYRAAMEAAPAPPHMSMTADEARSFQNWADMDGACAFHLIERHASGWGEVALMMQAWLDANRKPPNGANNRIAPPQG